VLANCLSKEITSGSVAFQILGNEIVMAFDTKITTGGLGTNFSRSDWDSVGFIKRAK